MRRDGICLYLGPADRVQLEALCANRNTPRKVVWRAEIGLATADGCGTDAIMRRAETSRPTVRAGRRALSTKLSRGSGATGPGPHLGHRCHGKRG